MTNPSGRHCDVRPFRSGDPPDAPRRPTFSVPNRLLCGLRGAPSGAGSSGEFVRLSPARLAACVLLAMFAFAANSLFCRLALGRGGIDPASFTAIRLASGAVVLALLTMFGRSRDAATWRCDARSALALFGYAAAFSLAYRQLSAGTGALLLFGAVQVTMLTVALIGGERPRAGEWLGLVAAVAGLVYLVLPGVTAPPLGASAFMIVAGLAWGVYSLRGRGARDPLSTTARNFVWSVPLGVAFWFLWRESHVVTAPGVTWAVLSGALASGIGYAVWYTALPALSATRAATVQLTVPVLAAFGGVLFLGERITARLMLASALVLGGVALAIFAKTHRK
jgi:drug/metabolite transporter (DMT)-like permease